MQDSLLPASLQMILSLIFCDVISSSLFRSPKVAPLVARQPFLKIAYYDIFKYQFFNTSKNTTDNLLFQTS